MNLVLQLEREFRQNWRSYNLLNYSEYLNKTSNQVDRIDLLARLIRAELQFSYQPPSDVEPPERDEDAIRPNLRLILAHFPELSEFPGRVIELIAQEYAWQLRHDSVPPSPEAYLDLVPENQCVHLYELLHKIENTLPGRQAPPPPPMVQATDSTVKDPCGAATISLDPLPNNLGNFLVVDLISHGGMGTVYSAIDLRNAAPVAVKIMRRDDSWSIYRFIEEFRWLSQMSHPNLVKLYDACVEGEFRYFSMEIVEGRNVSDWFRHSVRHREDAWAKLKKVLNQAASALQFMHRNGSLHCDIKCSNLMITGKRRAVLLDLGLAVAENSGESGLGTMQYSAPEVIRTQVHSRASDWFSFGLMIYEILAGEFDLPTCQDSPEAGPGDLVRLYQVNEPKIREQMAGADPELIELCCKLVKTDPSARPTGEQVIERLGGSIPPVLTPTCFVGRNRLLAKLTETHLSTIEEKQSRVLLIGGESGIGKTSLIQHWLQDSDFNTGVVLQLRCFRQDQTPMRLLNGIVQDLVLLLRRLPQSLWRESLEQHIDGIRLTFPQVSQLVSEGYDFKARPTNRPGSIEYEDQSLRHLQQWLVKLNRQAPLLIVVDDAQWADERSLNWLAEFLQSRDLSATLVLVDETIDASSSGSGHVQNAMMQSVFQGETGEVQAENSWFEQVFVEPLDLPSAYQLLLMWSREFDYEISERILENIVDRSGGNPFLLQELLQTFVHYARRGSITEEIWLADNPASNSLRSRISLLPREIENILHYLAVADRPLSFQQLKVASRMKTQELQSAINRLESQGWILSSVVDGSSSIEISHERFRKAILSSLPKDRLERRHFHIAKMLASSAPPPWALIGQHYWMAKQFREAATCYLQAAHQASGNASYQQALEYLQRASHPDTDRSPKEIRQVRSLEADCLGGVGNAVQSANIYLELTNATDDADDQLFLRAKAVEQLIRGGQLEEAEQHLSKVFDRLRLAPFKRGFLAYLGLRLRILRDFLALPRKDVERSDKSLDKIHKTFNRLGVPLTILDDLFGPEMIVRMKRLTDSKGSTADRAIAATHFGILLCLNGGFALRRGLKWLNHGRELAIQSNSSTARALQHFVGF